MGMKRIFKSREFSDGIPSEEIGKNDKNYEKNFDSDEPHTIELPPGPDENHTTEFKKYSRQKTSKIIEDGNTGDMKDGEDGK
jgi:hypothetical protein